MFGLGYQEALLVFILLVIGFVISPGLFYVFVLLGLKLLSFPRRVIIALCCLGVVRVMIDAAVNESGVASIVIGIILVPLEVAFAFAWLWLSGSLWERIRWIPSLSRLGSRWRETAVIHFRSTRGTTEVSS